VLGRRHRDALYRGHRRRLRGEHADDLAPDVVDLDVLAERRIGAEQIAPHAGADHADLGVVDLVAGV
jgi:hypothetical protein